MKYRTVIGKVMLVEPVPEYFIEDEYNIFTPLKFNKRQAASIPLLTNIALSVAEEPNKEGLYLVHPGTEYYKNVE